MYRHYVEVTKLMKMCICFRVDYIPHPLEKHYIHQGEKYRPPEGEMEMMTNYNREYTSKYYPVYTEHDCPTETVTINTVDVW